MSNYDDELLKAAHRLVTRRNGQRGKLPAARIRRSISTAYYALFHFILDEVGTRVAGSNNDLRRRRRILARTLSHSGVKKTLDKVRGKNVDASVAEFLRPAGNGVGLVNTPLYVQDLARAFSDAQSKRNDADYDLNKSLSATDASLLRNRVRRVIASWRAAKTADDRDFKHALCILLLLKGQLRSEN